MSDSPEDLASQLSEFIQLVKAAAEGSAFQKNVGHIQATSIFKTQAEIYEMCAAALPDAERGEFARILGLMTKALHDRNV